jgi:hypothetical protein
VLNEMQQENTVRNFDLKALFAFRLVVFDDTLL